MLLWNLGDRIPAAWIRLDGVYPCFGPRRRLHLAMPGCMACPVSADISSSFVLRWWSIWESTCCQVFRNGGPSNRGQREAEHFLRRQCQKQQKRPKHELFKPIASVAVKIPLGAGSTTCIADLVPQSHGLCVKKRRPPWGEQHLRFLWSFQSLDACTCTKRIWMYLDGCANGCARVILCQCRSSRIVRKP